jgi:hypothetical protein
LSTPSLAKRKHQNSASKSEPPKKKGTMRCSSAQIILWIIQGQSITLLKKYPSELSVNVTKKAVINDAGNELLHMDSTWNISGVNL